MKSIFAIGILAVLLATLAFGLVGCGNGNSNSATSRKTGTAQIVINWPDPNKRGTGNSSRYIPLNALSVRITFTGNAPGTSTPVTWATIYSDRPAQSGAGTGTGSSGKTLTTIETVNYLPVGPLNVKVEAFSVYSTTLQNGGSSTPAILALGTTNTTIIVDQTVQLPITLGSTIDHLTISPVNPLINLNNPLTPGATIQLQATAYDSNNSMVPLYVPGDWTGTPPAPPSQLQWASINTDLLSATSFDPATGYATFTGNLFGTATVTVLDQGSKVSGSTKVKVQGNVGIVPISSTPDTNGNYPTVTLQPLNLYGTQDFKATLTGTTNLRVNWDIVDTSGTPITDGTAGTLTILNNDGATDSRVRYAPPINPRKPGSYTIRATAQAFPDQSTTLTLTVLAGYGQITITNGP